MTWKLNPFDAEFTTGPNCEGCPFRKWSVGFVPPQGMAYTYRAGEWLAYLPGSLFAQARYFFLGKFPGRDEVLEGKCLVGPSGQDFNELMTHTSILRSNVVISNVVHCRPIVWIKHEKCKGAGCKKCRDGMFPHFRDSGDCINADLSLAQIRECASRYLDQELEWFQGDTIIGMGDAPAIAMTGVRRAMRKYRGTKWEHGAMMKCGRCEASGQVPGGFKKCPTCKGKGHVPGAARPPVVCKQHPKRQGKVKPRGECEHCWGIWRTLHPTCSECEGERKLPRPRKTCRVCEGSCELPEDPNKDFVSRKLRPGQIFYQVYNPAILFQDPPKWEVLVEDFSRIPELHEELKIEALKDYEESPPLGKVYDFLVASQLTLDLETTGLDDDAEILLTGVSRKPLESISVSAGHSLFREFLKHKDIVGQNWMQYDAWLVWLREGILPPESVFDTRMAGHLLNPDTPNDLVYLTGKYARPRAVGYWKTDQMYKDNKPLVAMIDTDMTTRVKNTQVGELDDIGLLNHFYEETMPTAHVAFDMRRRGLRMDREKVSETREILEDKVDDLRLFLPDWGGTGSEGQSQKIIQHLYENLKLPEKRDRKTQKLTSQKRALQELRSLVESNHSSTDHLTEDEASDALHFLELIDTLRDSSKLMSFFRPDNIPHDGFVHPKWNSVGTATMRWSVSGIFNPMVLPKGRGARDVIIGDEPGWEIMTVDISQAEVVGFLWAAEEWGVLNRVLHEGLDAHTLMADEMGFISQFGHEAGRARGKTATFAYIYGEAPRTTAMRTGLSLPDVKQIRSRYDSIFPGIPAFRDLYIGQAMDHGYVESPFGPRRYIRVKRRYGRGANQAANAPIQSIPPHVIRRGMIRLHRHLPAPARLILNTHDELTVTYPRELRDEVATCLTDILRTPVPELPALPVGMGTGLVFNIDIKIGDNWGQLTGLSYADGKWEKSE